MNEDACGSDPAADSIGTGSDRGRVPPFVHAGDEATASVRAVAMIAKRNIALLSASTRHQSPVMPMSPASIDFAHARMLPDRAEGEPET
jgi:hypothetical protein